jgi:hypothetical protein
VLTIVGGPFAAVFSTALGRLAVRGEIEAFTGYARLIDDFLLLGVIVEVLPDVFNHE